MTTTTYAADRTALLIVDPYNDFMSEGGKLYERTKETAAAVGFYDNMRKLIPAIRAARLHVIIVPHHRWRDSDYKGWKHMNPSQVRANQAQGFAAGSWGGEFHPAFGPRNGDVVVLEHWAQSGFANTDLDAHLTQRGIEKLILVGMVANTCVEGTARFGMELGYHVTLMKDATAAFEQEGMHAAHEVNGPRFAHAMLTTEELLALLPASQERKHDDEKGRDRSEARTLAKNSEPMTSKEKYMGKLEGRIALITGGDSGIYHHNEEETTMTKNTDTKLFHAGLARSSAIISPRSESKNKALVLEAFDTLFNKRDYAAAERYWSPNYIQHSAHIEPGRDGLFNLIKSIPPTLKYEPGMIVAEGDLVIIHGRFSGFGQPVNWIAADIVRIADGVLAEHWDVIQDEATREQSKSGKPMFGNTFPK